MKNTHLDYEFQFIRYFNNKKFFEFPPKWQKHLKRMFPEIEDETVVHCSKHENYYAKGDIDIRIKGSRKIVSLKNGRYACMHNERFACLYKALKENGVSMDTLNMVTLYQFGESRAYGHMDKPLTKDEIVREYDDLILKANAELNDERIVSMMVDRAVITGAKEYRQPIDYLYYGNLEKGILISKEQIYESIKSRKQLSSSWLHFGQLVFQPAARSRETERFLDTTIRWPALAKLFYIAKDEDNILECGLDSDPNPDGAPNIDLQKC